MRASLAVATLVLTSLCSAAGAGAISGSMVTPVAYSVQDLSDGTTDWVAYGGLGVAGTATDKTSKTASSSFGNVVLTAGSGPYTQTVWGPIKFAHDEGYGSYPAATTSIDANPVCANSASLAQLRFTHTLLGEEETIDVFVFTKHASLEWVDVSANLNTGGSWSVTNQQLPTVVANKGCYGIVRLHVEEASAGDQLTFVLSSNYSNNTNPQSWWGVSIAGATATAVPEPATMGLLVLGGIAGVMRRRR